MASVLIGTSGWSYKHWENGNFYPPKLPPAEFLPFLAQHFTTVEINYSYYQLPPRKTFELWKRKSPPGFLFAVKASRYLTHMKKLKDPEEDRKSTRLNSSHVAISYAVFCLKK